MLISLSLSTISSRCSVVTEVVQRLEGQAALHRGVADADRDPLPARRVAARAQIAGRGQSDADADPGPGVPAVEDVVLALAAAREAADAVELAQRLEAIAAAGQQLVGVRLVPGVPHDPVARRVHDPVQRERDLHGAQRAGEVAARVLDGADHLLAQLGGERLELSRAQPAQLRGVVDRFEEGHARSCSKSPKSIDGCPGSCPYERSFSK